MPSAFFPAVLSVCFFVIASVSAHAQSSGEGQPVAEFDRTVKPFLKRYCVQCHGNQSQKGDRRFDKLAATIADDDTLVDFQDILDLLNLGEMPPEDAKQPSDGDRQKVIRLLTGSIDKFHQTHQRTGETVLRRLNSREYRNTVRDLLHLDVHRFDPTSAFPRDQTKDHLDNIGDTLVTSGHLLARYLDAADLVIEKAMTPMSKPEVKVWEFRDRFRQQPEIDQVHGKTNGFSHMTLYDVVGADKPEGAYGPIHAFEEGVPVDGVYEIRLKAEAVNRLHPYDLEFVGTDPSEPLRLGIVPGDHLVGNLHLSQPNEPLLAEIDLADESKWYTVRVWLDQGITPRFTFRNGLLDARNMWSRLIKKYRDQFPKDIKSGIVGARFNAIKHGKLPQIHIHEIEIEGPIYDDWPTASHRALLGDDWESVHASGKLSEQQMRTHLGRFLSRAYRRPATDEQIDRVMDLIAARRKAGKGMLESYGDGLKAVLCSPNFLYLEQPNRSQLSPFALASRLSYFLWSSMPDQELWAAASSGTLAETKVLQEQVERMLSDPKSEAFVDGFLGSWLTLRELGSTPPDRSDFRHFYHYDLDAAMRRETHLFFRHIVDDNLDVVNFLDSDFTFVNQRLADHYGMNVDVDGFERVDLHDPRRGGLLGQASVLTVTANGIDTSPVVRGVWMLENILGDPPSPPPPDVEPLDPDVRGAKTIRDQLSKHRDVASCNECHRKIDPIGFALENFDPIGGWRQKYNRDATIDSSGQLPGGKAFEDVVGFKKVLVGKKDQFLRALSEKLMAYAIGRPIEPADRPHVDAVLEMSKNNGDGFRDLVKSVVLSTPFRSK